MLLTFASPSAQPDIGVMDRTGYRISMHERSGNGPTSGIKADLAPRELYFWPETSRSLSRSPKGLGRCRLSDDGGSDAGVWPTGEYAVGWMPYPILVFCGMPMAVLRRLSVSPQQSDWGTGPYLEVYFPDDGAPSSDTSLVDFALSAGLLVVLLAWYQYLPGPRVLLLPGFVLIALAAAFGAGLWISALTVKYRDFRFIVPFIVQFGLYVSPVGFRSDVVPEQWRLLYSLNPMVGVIDGFRWAILRGPQALYWPGFLLSVAVVSLLLGTGIRYFRKTERTFADVI